MDQRAVDQYYHFIYDPVLYGLSLDYWTEVSGAAALVSNQIRLRTDTIVSKEQYAFGDFVFRLTFPTAPAAGDVRRFGLISPVFGVSKNAIYFDISGTTFTANVVNDAGTTTSTTITWSSDWTNTAADFRIHWDRGEARFYINDVTFALVNTFTLLPRMITLPVYLRNDNIDNVDMTYLLLRNVYQVAAPRWAIPEPADDTLQHRDIDVSQSVSVAENVKMMLSIENKNIVDAITVSENVLLGVSNDPNVHEDITVAEDIVGMVSNDPNINETITVAENVAIDNHIDNMVINDTIAVAENITTGGVDLADTAVNDAITVAEFVDVDLTVA